MITEACQNLNKKLAEMFGLEIKNLVRFQVSVEPGRAPIINAVYIGADSPENMVIKSREIESIENANP
jgi:hypothetical protein